MALALDGAPALVDNPRQLALERSRKEEKKLAAAAEGKGGGAAGVAPPSAGGSRGQGALTARPLQVESRGKSGKRRIQPMLLSNGGSAPSTGPLVLTAPPTRPAGVPGPRWEGRGGAGGVGTVSEGFGAEEVAGGIPSPRSGHKRPRIGGGGGGGGACGAVSGGHHRHHAVGVRSREGAVVRLRAGSAMPVVSPPDLMPRRGASGSLVRRIGGGDGGRGGDAFRPPPRIRDLSLSSGGIDVRVPDTETRGAGEGVAVMECSALDEEFRGLPARRYTLVTVTRGGGEAWRDYVAGAVTACCGNARVAAVGAEDGSVYVYDRCACVCPSARTLFVLCARTCPRPRTCAV